MWEKDNELDRNIQFTRSIDQRYCAPELLKGSGPTVKSDVWAFGMVALYALTDHRPYWSNRCQNESQTTQAIWDGELPKREVWRWITDEVWQLLLDCWKQNPEERLDMTEVYERFVKIEQAGVPAIIPPQSS